MPEKAQPTPPAPDSNDPKLAPNLAAMLHEGSGEGDEKPVRRRKRRWLRVVGVIVLILIVLVLFAPYLASMPPVRSFVVSQINKNLAGSVAIADYSVGWPGGVRARGG